MLSKNSRNEVYTLANLLSTTTVLNDIMWKTQHDNVTAVTQWILFFILLHSFTDPACEAFFLN